MLIVPHAPEFMARLDSHAGRITTTKGASITPGNNTKGSYAQIISGASVTFDVWAIEVHFHANSVSAAARDTICDIGVDKAGGTSYTVAIPDLGVGQPNAITGGQVTQRYYFPLFIPAGSSIAARSSINNATVGTHRAFAILYGKPKYPHLTKVGHVVEAIGVTAGSSRGTTITPGTTSEGSWASLGTVTRDAWWWQMGLFANDTTLNTASTTDCDLSAGGSGGDLMVLENVTWWTTSAEVSTWQTPVNAVTEVAAGSTIYGRGQCASTPNSSCSMIAYALS
jgi:hypothetical protein